ncbi:hypothetical protein EAI89_22280 [Eubacterium sp. am_0171]|nr:hypothetical protein EAI89_22280 [Eubacterium sp. am_0171]
MRLFRSKKLYGTLKASKISISLPGRHRSIHLPAGWAHQDGHDTASVGIPTGEADGNWLGRDEIINRLI